MRQPRLVVRQEVGEDSVVKFLAGTTASLHRGKPSRVVVTDSNEHSSFGLYSYSVTACFKCSCHEALRQDGSHAPNRHGACGAGVAQQFETCDGNWYGGWK